ncbi:MAG: outer membrane beta-barrel protein [Salibacteraceae bacterium]
MHPSSSSCRAFAIALSVLTSFVLLPVVIFGQTAESSRATVFKKKPNIPHFRVGYTNDQGFTRSSWSDESEVHLGDITRENESMGGLELTLAYQSVSRWGIQSGIRYANHRFRMQFSEVGKNNTAFLNYRVRRLSIPLLVSYELKPIPLTGWRFRMAAGPSFDWARPIYYSGYEVLHSDLITTSNTLWSEVGSVTSLTTALRLESSIGYQTDRVGTFEFGYLYQQGFSPVLEGKLYLRDNENQSVAQGRDANANLDSYNIQSNGSSISLFFRYWLPISRKN